MAQRVRVLQANSLPSHVYDDIRETIKRYGYVAIIVGDMEDGDEHPPVQLYPVHSDKDRELPNEVQEVLRNKKNWDNYLGIFGDRACSAYLKYTIERFIDAKARRKTNS